MGRKIIIENISEEDKRRKLNLLKIILQGVIFLSFVAVAINFFVNSSNTFVTDVVPGIVLLIFVVLYYLTIKKYWFAPSLILVGLLSIFAYYFGFRWGQIIPTNWMLLVLSVMVGGILISAKFAIFLAAIHTLVTLTVTHFQSTGQLQYESWDIKPTIGSVLVTMVILGIIALISWLSNREIEKALYRAHKSEASLKKQRDLLEIRVEKRTREIERIQMEKVMQVYRFADFGKLAAGLIHDIVTPLNVVTLNLENLKEIAKSRELQQITKRAIISTKNIEEYVENTRRQISGRQTKTTFNLTSEIDNILAELKQKAKDARVSVNFVNRKIIYTFGNSFRFHQLASNLIANAIDAYAQVKRRKNREILIRLSRQNKMIMFEVEDHGIGISAKNLPRIFEPFFTTKTKDRGVGIGLTICKDIAEKDFGGSISVKSRLHKGATFTVQFPVAGRKQHV